MPKTHAQNKQIQRDRKRAAGMVRKDITIYPSTWPKIKALIDKETNKYIDSICHSKSDRRKLLTEDTEPLKGDK